MTLERSRIPQTSEEGFTLLELLVVLVVIPVIIGGIASALIVSFNDENANSSRLSDSVNAQITQDYFVRDVQGASYITTLDNSNTSLYSYGPASPQICTPGAGNLLVGLYHPAEGNGSAPLDVSYWAEGSGSSVEIDRYSCALNTTSYVSTGATKTPIATPPPSTSFGKVLENITATTEVTPSQFATGAASGWTAVAAFTTANSFSGTTLTVGSTSGFTTGTVTVRTAFGLQSVSCSAVTSSTFTGCGILYGVESGSPVTQSSVSGVQITVAEPASSYHYSLLGSPRSNSPQQSTATARSPNLLTLGPDGVAPVNGGGGATCPDGTTANICIGTTIGAVGSVVVDSGGVVFCNGAGVHKYIHFQTSGTVDTTAPSGTSGCNGVTVTGSVPTVADPLQGNLPNNGCFPASLVNQAAGGTASAGGLLLNPSPVGGNAAPGVYTGSLGGTLEPGIYVVEGGIGSITGMAPDTGGNTVYYNGDPNAGVLLFVPGAGPYNVAEGCFGMPPTTTPCPTSGACYTLPASVGGSIAALQPFDSTQASNSFQGNHSLGGVWLWQDGTNPNGVSLTGYTNGVAGQALFPQNGLLYAPGADYVPPSPAGSLSTGAMIIAGTASNGTHLSLCLNWTYTASC